jgi:aspartate aminotransferase-like enzyme
MAELIAMQSFVPPHRVLMGPGPSDVPKRVLETMSQETIGHLDPAFVGLMDEIEELLRRTFRTRNAFTFPVSGPGSAGMEMCFANLVEPGDTVYEADVRRRLTNPGIEIGAGSGAQVGHIGRVGLMGHSSRPENVLAFVTALAAVGEQLRLPLSGDAALEAVERSLRSADPGQYSTAGKA